MKIKKMGRGSGGGRREVRSGVGLGEGESRFGCLVGDVGYGGCKPRIKGID